MLSTSTILDDALSLIQDDSVETRAKMLAWLNMQMQRLSILRPWNFMCKATVLTPVLSTNYVVKPSDYLEFISAYQPTKFYFDESDRLDKQAINNVTIDLTATPYGWTEDATNIYFYPGVSGNINFTYTAEVRRYSDSAMPTVFPNYCRPLLVRACLDFYYEFDMDDRSALSYQMDAALLSEVKAFDNKQRPLPKYNKHGYLKG